MPEKSPLLTNGNDKYRPKTVLLLILLFALNVILGIVIPILSESNSLYSVELLYAYQPGELANEDVIAPYDFSFTDEIATERLREENAAAVIPRFTYSMAQTQRMDALARQTVQAINDSDTAALESLFSSGDADAEALITKFALLDEEGRADTALLLDDAVDYFLRQGIFSSSELDDISGQGYTTVYAQLPSDYKYTLSQTMSYISNLVTDENLDSRLIDFLLSYNIALTANEFQVLYGFLDRILSANVHYDALGTESLRDQARQETPEVTAQIHRGDYILRYDTIVTEQALQTIRMINGISVDISVPQLAGRIVFLAVILYVSLYFISNFIERKYRVLIYTLIFLITLALMLILSYLSVFFFQQLDVQDQIIPFLFLPLLMCQLTSKKRVGFICGTVFACFILFFPSTDIMTFFYLLFSIEVSLMLVRFSTTRIDMIYQGFYTALVNILITLVFHFIEARPLILLFQEVIAISLNVAVTYVAISLLLPLLEHFLNIPTVFRLNELSRTDSAVLVRLRTQAIGTYNHSLNVSDMAYNAAREIGANAELARVGGLYHDIGKAEHPEYFIENQAGGPNVHDEMKYTLSAAVIKSHVKLGVEKAKEVGLPQEVIDIIDQHHGNDIISYFYNKAVEDAKASKTPVQVNEDDFRYNSDIPQTREAGIVMLADCFEAASRTLKKPTTLRYEKLFTSILVGKMNGNQLDECMLSMAQIEKIKRVFVHQAFGRDHMRIQYSKNQDAE